MADEQQEAQRRWHEVQKIAAVNERLTRENATLRRKSEALRKRLADAERKLQPGDVSPDMHACERAMRDMELLEKIRTSGFLQDMLDPIRIESERWINADRVATWKDLIALLTPGDAGRGEGGE